MATYYSQGSGLWSTLANWNTVAGGGGSNPASIADMEDDLFIIQAGHVIDYDLTATSSWTTGFQTITIQGHATTPGTLRCDSTTLAAGNYILPMKTGFSIVGTSGTEKGRILSNSDGVWANTGALANDRKFIIKTLAGTSGVATIDATYLTCRLYCTQPSNTYVEIYGVPFVVTFDNTTEKFTIVSPANTPAIPPNGTPIVLSGTLPAELVAGTTYFVKAVSGATGELEATIGGGTIAISDNGSGTIYMHYGCWGPVAQATNVNTTTGVITWNGVPPAADTPIRVKSSDTLPTGLTEHDLYYVRTISGNTCKLSLTASDAGIVIPSTVGSGNISMYCGSTYTTSKVVNVVQDVTADIWAVTAEHNAVVLCDIGPADYDQQRDTLATINARYMVLTTNNIDSAQYPLAKLFLSSRNISLRSASTSGSQIIVSSSVGGVFQCEIRNTYQPGTMTTFYSYAFNYGSNNTISGIISGCGYGLINSYNHTLSGIICGCNNSIYNGHNNTISGIISGNSVGVFSSNNNTISGIISGCSYGLNSSNNNTVSGIISGCSSGLSAGNNNTVSGIISGCSYLSRSSGAIGATLINANIYSSPSFFDRNTSNTAMRIACENFGRVEGSMKIFEMFGDIIKTACDGTGDAPSVDPDAGNGYCIEVSNVQSNLGIPTGSIYPNKLPIFTNHRIWMAAAAHTVTYKVQTTYAGITAGNLVLTARYITTGGALTEITNAPAIATRSDDTDWTQTLAVTFTPAQAGWVDFKMEFMEYESGNELYVWPTPVIT